MHLDLSQTTQPNKHVMINVTVHGFAHKASVLNSSYDFEESITVCHCRKIILNFPMLPCFAWAIQLRDDGTYAADLFQAAWRLLRPFLGRWNIKRDPAGYTSNVIGVQNTTERHSAEHARLLIPTTLSYRQLMAVCLQRFPNETNQAMTTM